MDETLRNLLLAFGAGLLLGMIFWWQQWRAAKALRAEIAKLYEQLALDMRIRDKGNKIQAEELENLRRDNENLRITVKTLKAKPGRAELELLHVYDHAVREMCQRAPGFSPTWELVLREARTEMAKSDTGLAAFVRRVFRPSHSTSLEVTGLPRKGPGDGPQITDSSGAPR